jgi:hypothetical protein
MRARLLYPAAIAFAMVFGTCANSQVQPCGLVAMTGMIGAIGRPNVPFSGVVKSSFEQKLGDGNAIHRVTLTRQARDSAGRTMTEMVLGCARDEDGQMHQRLNVNVNDPVAHTDSSWQVGVDDQPKVVHVFQQPVNSSQAKRPVPTPEQLEQRQKMMKAAQTQQLQTRREMRTEDLGGKDFHGVSASGTRSTRTIPAGEEGNDQPLVVVNETWRSKELGVTVMLIRDDPRTGRYVTEFEELTRGEPDPSLFTPPTGYTVQERQIGTVSGFVMGGISQ